MATTARQRTTKKPRPKPRRQPQPPTKKYSAPWRNGIDWVAAGRKAYETRMRNLGQKPAKPGKPGKKQAAAPVAKPARTYKPRRDENDDAYAARLTASLARTAKQDTTAYNGRDMGGGWVIIATDGSRALTRQVPPTNPQPVSKTMTTETPAHWIDLSDELEQALRELRDVDKKSRVTLAIDARKNVVVVQAIGADGKLVSKGVPATGTLTKDRINVDAKFLLDGFGRGGRLGYVPGKAQALLLDTPKDGGGVEFRYALMPLTRS